MYCFLGLMKPTSGRVEVMGSIPDLGRPLYSNIAYLPEEPHYHLYLTVKEATRYYASLYGRRVSEKAITGGPPCCDRTSIRLSSAWGCRNSRIYSCRSAPRA